MEDAEGEVGDEEGGEEQEEEEVGGERGIVAVD